VQPSCQIQNPPTIQSCKTATKTQFFQAISWIISKGAIKDIFLNSTEKHYMGLVLHIQMIDFMFMFMVLLPTSKERTCLLEN
jgi:hypothetical protein